MYELATIRTNAIDVLWRTLGEIEKVTATAVMLNDLFVTEELNHALSTGGSGSKGAKNVMEMFEVCRDKAPLERPMPEFLDSSDIRATRPFVSDRIWSLFFVLRGVHLRLLILAGWSVDKQTYLDWRDDKVINQLLCQALSQETIEHGKNRKLGGLGAVIRPGLENEFMAEARRVLEGDVRGGGIEELPEIRVAGFDVGDE